MTNEIEISVLRIEGEHLVYDMLNEDGHFEIYITIENGVASRQIEMIELNDGLIDGSTQYESIVMTDPGLISGLTHIAEIDHRRSLQNRPPDRTGKRD